MQIEKYRKSFQWRSEGGWTCGSVGMIECWKIWLDKLERVGEDRDWRANCRRWGYWILRVCAEREGQEEVNRLLMGCLFFVCPTRDIEKDTLLPCTGTFCCQIFWGWNTSCFLSKWSCWLAGKILMLPKGLFVNGYINQGRQLHHKEIQPT